MENSFRKIVYYIVALVSIVLVIYAIVHRDKLGYVSNDDMMNTDLPTGKMVEFVPGPASLGEWQLDLELADTKDKQEKGLSGRESMPPDTGMLFIFPEPSAPGFWMKEMLFPIDIIWLNADKEVVEVLPNVDPSTYNEVDPEIFTPLEPIKYVLEVNAGMAEANGIVLGDALTQ
jgi:uncharacterized membrane protein (UPF0127 family)